jgi:hypothetical protein
MRQTPIKRSLYPEKFITRLITFTKALEESEKVNLQQQFPYLSLQNQENIVKILTRAVLEKYDNVG